ncbi:hypothetical protein WKV44_03620 [Spirochaetia bacterium 38H-sp]|uniref:DUF1254 domain-containing protein n=1 Tax=Rarispira pelagica TaxID=3141764 RepID=A0ABU9UBS5_9SPIR
MKKTEKNLDLALIVLFFLAALALMLSAFWILNPYFASDDSDAKAFDKFSVSYMPGTGEMLDRHIRLYLSDSSAYRYVAAVSMRWNGILKAFFAYSDSGTLVSVFIPHNGFVASENLFPSDIAAYIEGKEDKNDVYISALFLSRARTLDMRIKKLLTDKGYLR